MNNESKILISSGQQTLRVPRKKIVSLVQFIAERENIILDQLDISVVGDDEMSQINWDFLQHEGTTDVISFDLSDEFSQGISGQLIVCADVAKTQGPSFGNSPTKELLLYVAHGLLHLIGYDDLQEDKKKIMHARQSELLELFLESQK